MIDIHTHILPCYDDGSRSIEISRKLLEQEIANGVSTVVLTPHQNKDNCDRKEINRRFNEFKEAVSDMPISLLLGSEVYYDDTLVPRLKNGDYMPIDGSKYLLVEFSTKMETPIADIVYDITMVGYTPIIAHIERYNYLTKQDIFEIRANGALIQVNARSFSNRNCMKLIKLLLKNEMLDFIASDCHNESVRNVEFEAAKKFISKKFKKQYDKFFVDNFNFHN